MTLSDEQRRRVAARARTLHGRLAEPGSEAGPEVDVEKWLDRWRETVADGDAETFEERLSVADVTLPEVRRRLSLGGWPEGEPLPDWVDAVDDLLGYVEEETPDEPPSDPIEGDEWPFTHLHVAVAEYAADQVDWTAVPDVVSESAVTDLKRRLVERTSALAAHPLFIEFKTFLAERDRELAFADDPEVPDPPARHYEAFVGDLRGGGLADLFEEYAVLARSTVRLVEMWVDFVEEFGAHLAADLPAVVDQLCDAADPGQVVEVDTYGDVHRDGRQVLGLTFSSGDRVAYKPRDVLVEERFSAVVEWLNRGADLPPLRTLDRVVRDGHGWVEWVEPTECADESEVASFYRRAGALVAVMYALNFADGNLTNILAEGNRPVIVDLETLLQPEEATEAVPGDQTVRRVFNDSVLKTYLLPMYLPEGDIQEVNGFASTEAQVSNIEQPEFENVNTDAMDVHFEDTDVIEGDNLPVLDGEHVSPAGYLPEMLSGFEEAYRFLDDGREHLLGEDGLLASFADAEVRYLYRPTETYGKVLIPLETPSYLRTGLAFGAKVERLARPFVDGSADRTSWPIYEAEREALWKIDIPRFTVDATERTLDRGAEPVAEPFVASPLERTRERVRSLGEDDLDEQLRYLELAYDPERYSRPDPPSVPRSESGPGSDRDLESVALRAARETFERLREAETRTGDDEPFWIVREYLEDGVYFPRVPDNFYTGRPGIATFAAALGAVTGEDTYRDYAYEVVQPSLDELEESDPFPDMKVGLNLGYGGLIYGCEKLWKLLDDDRFRSAARRTALLTTRERLESDASHLDPHRGSSGLILALSSLWEATGDDEVLQRAVLAGDYLLEHRIDSTGIDLWRQETEDGDRQRVTQGGDGIAYALFELAEATGADRFEAAARQGLEYGLTPPDRDPWPDVRSQEFEEFTAGWCDGQVGLGISRLALHEVTGDPELRAEAERLVRNTETGELVPWDNIYSGNLAHVELLRRAARTLDVPTYRDAARRIARETVARADEMGRFAVPWQTDDWYHPGFHAGETGAGYSLLRFVEPDLPNVLFWE